jgi:hypothetical protein
MELTKHEAKRLFTESPDWVKEKLVEEFGADTFKTVGYENIKTFDDACRACGTTEAEFNEKFNNLGLDADTINYEKAKVFTEAIRGDWKPDWNNTNQKKWFTVFCLSSGFGFSYSRHFYGRTDAIVGSRLCFETSEQSDYAGNQFIAIYKDLLT